MTKVVSVADVARIAHEANRAYCESLGDTTQKPWNEAADWQRESAMKGVAFRLEAKAQGVTPPASAQHDAWMADKVAEGWVFGPVKDASKKEHPCIVPYEQLPIEQRLKDSLFSAVVDSFISAGAL